MNWVQINIQVNEEFRYMKIHIFALRCGMVTSRKPLPQIPYGPEIFSGPIYNY